MLALYVEAPFAVCRTFTAGWYRPAATFLTPSAAYGLVLNLARVETRLREEDSTHPGSVPASLNRPGLPAVRIALGAAAMKRRGGELALLANEETPFPRVQTAYQHLHNYPVGSSGGERAATTFGNKYNITPVRREFLTDLRAVVVLDGNDDLEGEVRRGLAGELSDGRYGLPFLGDNSFLPDRIEILAEPIASHWYERVGPDAEMIRPRTTRMTTWIDRGDMSRSRSDLYAPAELASADVPEAAWTAINPPGN